MTGVVTSYVNPDTDGVCGALGFVELAHQVGLGQYRAAFAGRFDAETASILRFLDAPQPPRRQRMGRAVDYVLVDTHHIAQLPKGIPPERVRLVIDHHPLGDADLFANAEIQNETVGAACTLIAERFRGANLMPTDVSARLLACGILSNTLEFIAPSTTERDIDMFTWLDAMAPVGKSLRQAMRVARDSTVSTATATSTALERDIKVFEVDDCRVAIGQIEAAHATSIAERPDIWSAYESVRAALGVNAFVVNLVDLASGRSRIVAPDPAIRHLLEQTYALRFEESLAWTTSVFLRKTHLVPLIPDIARGITASRVVTEQ